MAAMPVEATVKVAIEDMMMDGLMTSLLRKGVAVSTDLLLQVYARRMREEVFFEGSPLWAIRDQPLDRLGALSPEDTRLWGHRLLDLTTAMATTIAGEGALCADHLRKV